MKCQTSHWQKTPLKSALKNLNKNISVLRRHLKLTSDEEWRDWLRSPNFLLYWDELWTSWLSNQYKKYRDPGIEKVLTVMQAEAEDFDDKHVDKAGWDDIHHYASFMHQILRRNLNHTDGLFKNRPMGPNEAEAYLWATMRGSCSRHKCISSKHKQAGSRYRQRHALTSTRKG